MSYRGFKRLLGETGLERKCRYLLGSGVILLMSISFYVYAWQTEELAYDQLQNTGQTLVPAVIARVHLTNDARDMLDKYQRLAEEDLPTQLKGYKYKLYAAISGTPDTQPTAEDLPIVQAFQKYPELKEETKLLRAEKAYLYFSPVRAGATCLELFHQRSQVREEMEATGRVV